MHIPAEYAMNYLTCMIRSTYRENISPNVGEQWMIMELQWQALSYPE